MTLLTETISALKRCGVTPANIEWIGSYDGKHAVDWATFEKIADFSYDSGYGGQVVARDLVIVGPDWWMDRSEYDGSEWWQFHRKPERQPEAQTFTCVNGNEAGWGGAPIEEIEDELKEARENPIGWNAIFHTHPIGMGREA